MKLLSLITLLFIGNFCYSQTWQDVGGGTNNSSHGMLTWNGKLINLGSYNGPCNRVSEWDGTSWTCLGGGVGIVARAGVVWDGKLVVVGDFWNVQQPCVGCNGVAVWDGVSWTPLGNGVNNDVLTCTVWNNQLVIGGDMTQADGVPVARIAKWNGATWESVGPIGSFDNDIRCMTEFEGDLWVGGDFNNVGGQGPLDGLVKYDEVAANWVGGNSGVDLIGGVNESVRVLYVNPNDGNLYMGGEFPELIDGNAGVQDFNMSGIAMYDGSDWTPLGTGLNEYCRAMHEYNGDIIAGGYFTDAGGTPANKIAKWDGTNWTAMGLGFDGIGVDEYVKSAAVWNGIFFAGGAYTQAEGGPMNYIAQWYEPATAAPVAWMTTSTTQLCGSGCVEFLDNSTNAPTSWNWSFPGSSTPTSTAQDPGQICYATAGTYTATLQACNAIGCTTQNIDIEVTSGATVTVNDESICSGGPVTLTATPSISGGSFLWVSTSETTGSISVNPAITTTYTVTYEYLGCVSNAVSTVTVGVGPTVNVSGTNSLCQGQTTTLTATPDAGGGTYLWSPGGETTDNITVTPGATTDYTVEYTLSGCASTPVIETVTVNPSYNLNDAISTCVGATINYPDGSTEIATVNTMHTSNMLSAAGCDSIVVSTVTVNQSYNLAENVAVCEGSLITYPDGFSETITANTSHTSNILSVAGCDSIIVTTVSMNSAFSSTENHDVCTGSAYTYPDGMTSTNITANESHVSNLTTANGCDSVISVSLNVISAYTITESPSICAGNNYTYPDGTTVTNVMVNESHVSSLLSSNGCDSTITSNLLVTPIYNLTESISVCSGGTYTYPDGFMSTNVTANESHTSNLTSVAGCDSIINSNLAVNSTYASNESVTICTGNTINYPDGSSEVITANTTHISNLSSLNGCDSTITTNVTAGLLYNELDNQDICSGANYTYPDGTTTTNVTTNESHVSNLTSVFGCDSVVTTNLTVVSAYNTVQSIDVCSGDSYTYPDGTSSSNIINDESHVSNLVSSTGCDSIITSNLTVNDPFNSSENVSVCGMTAITYPDGSTESITANTVHTSNMTTAAGCDSIIVTNVTFNDIYALTDDISLCVGDNHVYPDGTSSSNIQVDESHTSNLTSSAGCDSTITTSITVITAVDNTVSELNTVLTANQGGASYQWVDCNDSNNPINGETDQTFVPTVNGSYAVEITAGGCSDVSACVNITTIGLEEINANGFTVYPNPTTGTLYINGEVLIESIYDVVDATGRILMSGSLDENQQIDIQELAPGTYTVRFGTLGQIRIVKE